MQDHTNAFHAVVSDTRPMAPVACWRVAGSSYSNCSTLQSESDVAVGADGRREYVPYGGMLEQG